MSGLPKHIRTSIAAFAVALVCAVPAVAFGDTGHSNGGVDPSSPEFQPHGHATLLSNGQAIAPTDAPPEVQAVIEAGNKIATLPYVYGGGHNAKFSGSGYDCSGSVSYALHGGGLLTAPLDSSSFMHWGDTGPGSWITIYTNPGHAYMLVAGLRFDTSMRTPLAGASRRHRGHRASTGGSSSRWSTHMRSSRGYMVRHPVGY